MDRLPNREPAALPSLQSRMARQEMFAAIGDVRMLGGTFMMLGCFPLLTLLLERRHTSWDVRVMSFVDTIILVGPGVWYLVAAVMMRRLNRQAVTVCFRVATVQLVLVLLMLAIMFFSQSLGLRQMYFTPAIMAVFFIPALIALMFVFRKIGRLMNQVGPEGHGFEPIQVLPPDDPDNTPPPRAA